MERNLGFLVFERDSKKVIITKLGKEFLKNAKQIALKLDDIKKIKELNANPLNHELNIGIIPTISPFLIPFFLPALNKEYQNLKLAFFEEQTDDLIERVGDGELDMAIIALPYNIKGLTSYIFGSENFFWVSRKDDARSNLKKIKAKQIKLSELILLEDGNCLTDHILSAFKEDENSEHYVKATTLNTVVQLVKCGIGTTIIPEMAIKQMLEYHPDLTYSLLDEPGPHREISIITRKNYVGIENVKILLKMLKSKLELILC